MLFRLTSENEQKNENKCGHFTLLLDNYWTHVLHKMKCWNSYQLHNETNLNEVHWQLAFIWMFKNTIEHDNALCTYLNISTYLLSSVEIFHVHMLLYSDSYPVRISKKHLLSVFAGMLQIRVFFLCWLNEAILWSMNSQTPHACQIDQQTILYSDYMRQWQNPSKVSFIA